MSQNDHRDRRTSRHVGVVVPEGRLTPPAGSPAEAAGGPGPRRLGLRPSVEVFPASSGDVYLLSPGEPDLVVRRPDAADRALLGLLAGHTTTLDEVAGRLEAEGLEIEPAELEGKVTALLRAGVARWEEPSASSLSAPERERYDRQLPYFAEWGHPGDAQRALREATVVVLGCGGLGTWVLGALACAGVGGFVLIDDDSVELSNLNRQILFTAEDLGASKVERAAAWVGRFDPSARVRTVSARVEHPDDLLAELDGATAVVLAADWPPYELVRWVDEACRSARVPYLTAGQVPPILKIGPTYVPGSTACFACHERRMRAEYPLYDEIAALRTANSGSETTLGPASGVVGTLVALEVMHLLVGRPAATEGRALIVDMRTLETRWEAVERDPECPACGDLDGAQGVGQRTA